MKYGVDGVMIGRGSLIIRLLLKRTPEHTSKELLNLFRLHLSLFEKYSSDESQQFKRLRRFLRFMKGLKELVNYVIN